MTLKFKVYNNLDHKYLETEDGLHFNALNSPVTHYMNNPDYEVSLFANCHDKNGKEIYFEDVVSLNDKPVLVGFPTADQDILSTAELVGSFTENSDLFSC